jgi:hypothetical protein
MNDFKLKLILSMLGGIVFSLVFILLAFALPLSKEEITVKKRDANKLEKISQSLKEK